MCENTKKSIFLESMDYLKIIMYFSTIIKNLDYPRETQVWEIVIMTVKHSLFSCLVLPPFLKTRCFRFFTYCTKIDFLYI